MDGFLSLAQAAKFAGVTEATMRKWAASDIEGVERGERGSYRIPEHSLRVYLLKKSDRAIKGGVSGRPMGGMQQSSPPHNPGIAGDEIGALLRLQLDDKMKEIAQKDKEIAELKQELRETRSENKKLEAEMRAMLSGGVVSAVSRWIKGR
jgi:hypothetical protein